MDERNFKARLELAAQVGRLRAHLAYAVETLESGDVSEGRRALVAEWLREALRDTEVKA